MYLLSISVNLPPWNAESDVRIYNKYMISVLKGNFTHSYTFCQNIIPWVQDKSKEIDKQYRHPCINFIAIYFLIV